MISKNAKTILFAALITAMILPFSGMQSAEASSHGENLTTGQLQNIVDTSKARVGHYEYILTSIDALFDHRIVSIDLHQRILDALDGIVNSGGVLTVDQIALYNDNVDDIIWLEAKNVITESKIRNYYLGIAYHQAAIIWAQAEIDSRAV